MSNENHYQQLQHTLQLSMQMVTLAEQQEWDALIDHNLLYLPALENVLQNIEQYSLSEDCNVAQLLRSLYGNEKIVMNLLGIRMDELSQEIYQRENNKTGNDAYVSQFFGEFKR